MRYLRLQLIVEGYSEASILGGLVKRYLESRRIYNVVALNPINTKGCQKLKGPYRPERHLGIEYYVAMAVQKTRPDAVLVLLDADDECQTRKAQGKEALGPWLVRRAAEKAKGIPLRVVVVNRQLEAWIVAGWPSICEGLGCGAGDCITLSDRENAERSAGHVAKIARALGRPYSKREDPRILLRHLPFNGDVLMFAPSYKRFLETVLHLTQEAIYFTGN